MGFGASKPKVPNPQPADAKSITPPPESIPDDFKYPVSTESLEVMSNGPNAPHFPKPQYPPHSLPKTQKIAPPPPANPTPSSSRPHPRPSTASSLTKALNPHKHTQKSSKIIIKDIFLFLILQNLIILIRMMTGLKGN
jgi:hypothetical protein